MSVLGFVTVFGCYWELGGIILVWYGAMAVEDFQGGVWVWCLGSRSSRLAEYLWDKYIAGADRIRLIEEPKQISAGS